MTQKQVHDFSASHWGELIGFLSMDLTADVWPQYNYTFSMGHEAAVHALRGMILKLREAYAQTPDPMPDIRDWIFKHNALNWPEPDLKQLANLGADFIADHQDAPHLSGWQIALTNFPDAFPIARQAINSKPLLAEFEDRLAPPQDIVSVPTKLSPWDLQLCARHGWNPDSDEGFPPFDTLDIVTALWRTRDALKFAGNAFPLDAQRALWDEAKAVIDSYGVWMPAPLEPLWLEVRDVRH